MGSAHAVMRGEKPPARRRLESSATLGKTHEQGEKELAVARCRPIH